MALINISKYKIDNTKACQSENSKFKSLLSNPSLHLFLEKTGLIDGQGRNSEVIYNPSFPNMSAGGRVGAKV